MGVKFEIQIESGNSAFDLSAEGAAYAVANLARIAAAKLEEMAGSDYISAPLRDGNGNTCGFIRFKYDAEIIDIEGGI